jgi:hypothetical protein
MAALSFPASPVDGDLFDTFKYNATKGVWQRTEWAVISGGTESSYTLADGTSWVAHTFTSAGTLTVNKTGLLDMLCVGTGGGAQERYGRWGLGGGGAVRFGIRQLTQTGEYSIAVGSPSSIVAPDSVPLYVSGPGEGGKSWEGALNATKHGPGGGGAPGGISENSGTRYGGGQGGTQWGPTSVNNDGIVLDYTGTNLEYGSGGDASTSGGYGQGYGNSGNTYQAGGGGIVIVRYRV